MKRPALDDIDGEISGASLPLYNGPPRLSCDNVVLEVAHTITPRPRRMAREFTHDAFVVEVHVLRESVDCGISFPLDENGQHGSILRLFWRIRRKPFSYSLKAILDNPNDKRHQEALNWTGYARRFCDMSSSVWHDMATQNADKDKEIEILYRLPSPALVDAVHVVHGDDEKVFLVPLLSSTNAAARVFN